MSEPDAKPDGVAPANVNAGLWTRLRETPLVDALRGKWTRSLNMPVTLSSFELPETLQVFVIDVARKTRLWHKEQLDVAKELAGHFRDGLDAGATSEQLIERFGDVVQAAKMIRRARIRCRPLHWQIRRWLFRSMAAMFGLFLLSYSLLAIRYFTLSPTISRNYFDEINSAAKSIPEEDRAWPFYRVAVLGNPKLSEYDEKHWWNDDVYPPAHESPQWQDLVRFVESNRDVLPLIQLGAQRSKLGYVYGDPGNQQFLKEKLGGRESDLIKPDNALYHVLLQHTQELRSLARLLNAEGILAASQGNAELVAQDIQSLMGVASHARGNGFQVEELVSYAIMHYAMALTSGVLSDHPGLLTDQQLIDIAHRLSTYAGGGTLRAPLDLERWAFEDFLQRTFSDDGTGDGQLTPAGAQLIEDMGGPINKLHNLAPSHQLLQTLKTLSEPGMMALIGNRQDNHELAMRLFDLSVVENSGPFYTWKQSAVETETRQLSASFSSRLKYLPVLLFMPALKQVALSGEITAQRRDGILTAIALELYHRREGKWPTDLDELVPRYLPGVPLDRIAGDSIKFVIKNDHPVVYSVGMDRQDNGGHILDHKIDGNDPASIQPYMNLQAIPPISIGFDWILFPRFRETLSEKSDSK